MRGSDRCSGQLEGWWVRLGSLPAKVDCRAAQLREDSRFERIPVDFTR